MCGVTERAAQAIVTDLENAGYLIHTLHGRRNHYRVAHGTHFRHPAEARHEIAGLLALFADLHAGPGPDSAPATPSGDHHDEHP